MALNGTLIAHLHFTVSRLSSVDVTMANYIRVMTSVRMIANPNFRNYPE